MVDESIGRAGLSKETPFTFDNFSGLMLAQELNNTMNSINKAQHKT
jgi:hypothetical protein